MGNVVIRIKDYVYWKIRPQQNNKNKVFNMFSYIFRYGKPCAMPIYSLRGLRDISRSEVEPLGTSWCLGLPPTCP